MFVIIVEYLIKRNYLKSFIEAIKRQRENSLKEEGCIRFDICQNVQEKESIFLYEIYKDKEAFQMHLSQSYFTEYSETTKPWVRTKKVHKLDLIKSNR